MGSSTQTPTLNLPIFSDNDRPSWRGDVNGAMNAIDAGVASVNGQIGDILVGENSRIDAHLGGPGSNLLTSTGTVNEVKLAPQRGRHPLTGMIHLSAYCDPTGVADAATGLASAIADAQNYVGTSYDSNSAFCPDLLVDGVFVTSATHAPVPGLRMVGNGGDLSRIVGTNASGLFVVSGSTVRASWENLTLHAINGPVMVLSGVSTNSLRDCSFKNVRMWQASLNSPIWSHTGTAQCINVTFEHVEFQMLAGTQANRATVNPFYVKVDAGNIFNDNTFRNCTAIGRYSSKHFFYVECTNGGLLYNNTWDHVIGEFNQGGFFKLLGLGMFSIIDCPDWDTAVPYDQNIYHLAASGTNQAPSSGTITRSHRLGDNGLAANIFDIYAVSFSPISGIGNGIKIVDCDISVSTPATVSINGVVTWEDRCKPYKVVTTDGYTIAVTDPPIIVVNSAAAITLNLPASTTAQNGRTFMIKNVGAGVVTIPQSIDGGPATTLNQWAKIRVQTDGLNAALGRIWWSV